MTGKPYRKPRHKHGRTAKYPWRTTEPSPVPPAVRKDKRQIALPMDMPRMTQPAWPPMVAPAEEVPVRPAVDAPGTDRTSDDATRRGGPTWPNE